MLYLVTLPPNLNAQNVDEQIVGLQKFKEAFIERDLVAILMSIIAEPLENPIEQINNRFFIFFHLFILRLLNYVLGIIKNILSVPGIDSFILIHKKLISFQRHFTNCIICYIPFKSTPRYHY